MRRRINPEAKNVIERWSAPHIPVEAHGPLYSEANQLQAMFTRYQKYLGSSEWANDVVTVTPKTVLYKTDVFPEDEKAAEEETEAEQEIVESRPQAETSKPEPLFYASMFESQENKQIYCLIEPVNNDDDPVRIAIDVASGSVGYFDNGTALELTQEHSHLLAVAIPKIEDVVKRTAQNIDRERRHRRSVISTTAAVALVAAGLSYVGYRINEHFDLAAKHAKERAAAKLAAWDREAIPLPGQPIEAPRLERILIRTIPDGEFSQVPQLKKGDTLVAARETSIGGGCEVLDTHVAPESNVYVATSDTDELGRVALMVEKTGNGNLVICSPDYFGGYGVDVAIQARNRR